MEMKYKTLRLIANINKIFGYVIVLVGIISIFPALNIYFTRYYNGGFLELIFIPVGILCLGLFFVASGEIIYVLIDIEETNQSSTRYLEKVLAMMKSEIESRNVKIHEPRRNSKIADEIISATQKVELNTDNEIQTNSSEDFNDAYKYLIEKYNISKNDVLNKFVFGNKLYENLDAVLLAAMEEDHKKNNIKVVDPVTESIAKINSAEEALNFLVTRGYNVITNKRLNDAAPTAIESYEITKDGITHIKYSDDALINFANLVA